jgi:hypothetical protein
LSRDLDPTLAEAVKDAAKPIPDIWEDVFSQLKGIGPITCKKPLYPRIQVMTNRASGIHPVWPNPYLRRVRDEGGKK